MGTNKQDHQNPMAGSIAGNGRTTSSGRRSDYTAIDFAQFRAAQSLVLSPKFQRRLVWKIAAQSFFIDSLLRGMPVPPIYLRETQSEERDRTIREVVDGQQRIRAVLDFRDDKYKLSHTLKGPWAGKKYSQLSAAEQDRFSAYPFSAIVFPGISDSEVLQIFSRLNTYSVSLNKQELRNGQFFGLFKQSVYSLAYEHLEFWRRHRIFSETSIARMHEAEFVSEIFAASLEGMQDKKKSLDSFYEKYDEEFKLQDQTEKRFREVVDEISSAAGEVLADSVFRRPPILYSLFCCIVHRRFGLPGVDVQTPKKSLTKDEQNALRDAIVSLSEMVETSGITDVPPKFQPFVNACLQQTDNIKPRETRFHVLYRSAFG